MAFSTGVLLAFIAMLGFGLGNALSQVPVRKIGSLNTIFFRNAFSSVLLLGVLLVFPNQGVFSIEYALIALGISLIGIIPLYTFFKALEKGKVGIVTPIADSLVIFTVIFSVIFFKESLTLIQLAAILLIVTGIILVSVNLKDLKKSKALLLSSGISYALISCFLWGLVFFLLKIPVNVLGPILTSFIIELGIMIYSGAIIAAKKNMKIPDWLTLKRIFFVAAAAAVGTLFYNLGISNAGVSVVSAIAFSNPVVAAVYANIAYREKLSKTQWISLFATVLGIVIISAF